MIWTLMTVKCGEEGRAGKVIVAMFVRKVDVMCPPIEQLSLGA